MDATKGKYLKIWQHF